MPRQAPLASSPADLVIAAMPEQGEPLSDALLAAIRPQLIVLADTEFPASKRPKPALLTRLPRTGVPVLRLTETGSLTARFNQRGVTITTVEDREVASLSPP